MAIGKIILVIGLLLVVLPLVYAPCLIAKLVYYLTDPVSVYPR
jgi:hypothetical protein